MSHKIITISREFGTGGRTIGREAAAKLGIPCYDQEIISRIAEKSGFAEEYIKEYGEYSPSQTWIGTALSARDQFGYSNGDILWNEQRKVILELAEKGPCIIVGRCADYILKDKYDVLSVFIHASLEFRADRIVRVYGETDDKPEKRLKDKDKRRRAYYQLYTDMKWGVSQNYDICLDSGRLGIDKCVDTICQLYK